MLTIMRNKEIKKILSEIKDQFDCGIKGEHLFLISKNDKVYIANPELQEINTENLKINNTDISLVFSDWNMPNGDGIDLLDKVRSSDQEKLKYLKFVMVTGAHDKAFLAMDSGAHNIIHKPFNKINILRKLELLYRK